MSGIILVNNCNYLESSVLQDALEMARLIVGAEGPVVCLVTRGGEFRGGMAYRNSTRHNRALCIKNCLLETNGGSIKISPPREHPRHPIEKSQILFEVMVHEMKHVADYQTNQVFSNDLRQSGLRIRRPKWAIRPEEIRAVAAEKAALNNAAKLFGVKVIDDILLRLSEGFEKLAMRLNSICDEKWRTIKS